MFRGLSSWLGLQQPVVDGRPVEGDGQPEGEAPPEPRSEAVTESSERELLHQAKDLGGESPVGGWRERGRELCLLVGPLGTGEPGEHLGKAGASFSSQTSNLKFLVTCRCRKCKHSERSRRKALWPEVFRFDQASFLLSSPTSTSTASPRPPPQGEAVGELE